MYIGTTAVGLARIAASAAERAPQALVERGVRRLDVIPPTYQVREAPLNLYLERALLAAFW